MSRLKLVDQEVLYDLAANANEFESGESVSRFSFGENVC